MRTLHFGLRVNDLNRSLAFYTAVGYEVVGSVPGTAFGLLTMLRLPGDDFVTIELVHDLAGGKVERGAGLSHFVIKVESLRDTITALAARGVDTTEPESPNNSDDFLTAWLTDPDGNRIELVQWPAGHADGITRADWPSSDYHTGGPIDAVFAVLCAARPEIRIERLTVSHPGDSDNLWYFTVPGRLDVQIECYDDGQPPFLVEGHGEGQVLETADPDEATTTILAWLS